MACSQPSRVSVSDPLLQADNGSIWRIRFTSCGKDASAILAVPANASPSTALIVALSQTSRFGAREVMGFEGDAGLAFGNRFFHAGYVVLAPDIFIAGENFDAKRDWDTSEFYKEFPSWSAMGRMLLDHQNAVDAIFSSGRSPQCIAAVGHSLGGHNALFLGAFDKRINVVVSNAGFERIATDNNAERWARDAWFVYMPLLKPALKKPAPRVVPWDFDDVLRAIRPRPVFISQGTRDPIWTQVQSVSEIATAESYAGLRFRSFEGGHEFPPRLQDEALIFVREHCPP